MTNWGNTQNKTLASTHTHTHGGGELYHVKGIADMVKMRKISKNMTAVKEEGRHITSK